MVYLSIGLLSLSLVCVGAISVSGMPLEAVDDSEDEFKVLEGMHVGIPECKVFLVDFGIRSALPSIMMKDF